MEQYISYVGRELERSVHSTEHMRDHFIEHQLHEVYDMMRLPLTQVVFAQSPHEMRQQMQGLRNTHNIYGHNVVAEYLHGDNLLPQARDRYRHMLIAARGVWSKHISMVEYVTGALCTPGIFVSEQSGNWRRNNTTSFVNSIEYLPRWLYAESNDYSYISQKERVVMVLMGQIVRECRLVFTLHNIAFVLNNPEAMTFSDGGLFHGQDKPAIQWRDGTSDCYWQGTSYPSEWLTQMPSASEVLRLPNVEQRRAACEMLGWVHILNELGAETLDEHEDPEIGKLVSVQMDIELASGQRSWVANRGVTVDSRFLIVRCGTGREFALAVPPTVKTALEANAWTYGIDPSIYKPEVRT